MVPSGDEKLLNVWEGLLVSGILGLVIGLMFMSYISSLEAIGVILSMLVLTIVTIARKTFV